jgi:hypothetical protein
MRIFRFVSFSLSLSFGVPSCTFLSFPPFSPAIDPVLLHPPHDRNSAEHGKLTVFLCFFFFPFSQKMLRCTLCTTRVRSVVLSKCGHLFCRHVFFPSSSFSFPLPPFLSPSSCPSPLLFSLLTFFYPQRVCYG